MVICGTPHDSSMPLVQSFQNHQGLFVSRPILSPYPDSSIINLLPYTLDLDSNHFKMTCSVGLQDTLSRHSEQTAIHSLYLCLTILKYINKTEKERKKEEQLGHIAYTGGSLSYGYCAK